MKPEELKPLIDKLRADLSATNSALMAVLTAMPHDQHERALAHFARLTVMKEETAAQIPTPAARQAAQQMLEAEQRLYAALQGAYKMRKPG